MKDITIIINRNFNRKTQLIVPIKTFTVPRVYVPKKIRQKPNSYIVKPEEQIMVIWSHHDPKKGKKVEIKRSKSIQQWKTLGEQKQWAKAMAASFYAMLLDGYSPFSDELEYQAPIKSALVADLSLALDTRKGIIQDNTWYDYKQSLGYFSEWLNNSNHHNILTNSDHIGRVVDEYFKQLRDEQMNATWYNNIRSHLSALFGRLVKERKILSNPITSVDKLKADPKKNHPFSSDQVKENTEWMERNDPMLLLFLRIMAMSFLRPKEVMRIKVGDVDLSRDLISVKTKSRKTEYVPVLSKLRTYLVQAGIQNAPAGAHLIHYATPMTAWDATLSYKQRKYGERFRELKKALNYGDKYTIYSYRHTMALQIFESFKSEGLNADEILLKMKPITRHKSVAGLKNYLRSVGSSTADDYGSRFDLDL